eukprot:TRINITY_DN792_c0_g1_i1.p1 TRINITY_DN792_c0_g1~~TRINITY_DN792_c0_g1_i1.p1  ORF type:complete len:975 (+),score=154.07 TRINITY_DN792_c0_g1_i1:1968-4892(+)
MSMDTNKNLDELLAVIGDGSANPPNGAPRVKQVPNTARNPAATFSQPLQMPITPVTQPRSRPASSNMGPAGAQPNVNGHYNELLSLLQRQGTPLVNQQIPQQQNATVPRAHAGTNQLTFVPAGRPTPSQALDPKALAALKRQHQIQAAQAKQRRESLANVSSINRNTPPVPIPRVGTQGFPSGMPPVVNVQGMPATTKKDPLHNAHLSGQQRPNSAAQQAQSRSITQEQVIVGHFCRHAIKSLKKILEGLPYAAQGEARLREHIKAVWSQWVKGMITRPQLLQSVSNFVKQSSPSAKDVDVIKDFKAWYEHEYELQKQRTLQTQQQPKPVRHPHASGQNVNRANNLPVHPGNQAMRTNMAPQPLPAARTHMKVEPQRQNVPRNAGQTIGAKSEPMRVVPGRAPTAKSAVVGTGQDVRGRQLTGSTMSRPQPVQVHAPSIGVPNMMMRSTIPSQQGTVNVGLSKISDGRPGSSPKGGQKIIGGIPQVGVKSVGGKSLLHNKAAAQAKPKQPRRPPQKSAAKTIVRTSPKGAGKGKSPAAYPFHSGVHPGGNVQINYTAHQLQALPAKRVLEGNVSSSPPNAAKKMKTVSKPPKGSTAKKKPSVPVGNPVATKGARPPVQRPEQKTKGAKRPMASGALPPSGPTSITLGHPIADVAQKKNRRQEDLKEINLVDNVVDIEDEEVKLNVDASGRRQAVEEVVQYNPDMIVSGPILRKKMQSIAKRHGIHENINKEAMEMMSLAVRERLACILESLKTVASVRVGAEKHQWGRVETGLNVREKLQRAREDEERTLQVAAEMRVKRRKEQRDAEAKRLAGEAAKNDKSAKDASAAAEAERKEKLALEKKKKESSSQRDALFGLVRDYDRRRRRSAKPLAPLKPLGKPGLPPLVRRPNSDSLARSGLKPLTSLDRHKGLGPLVTLGGPNATVPRGLGETPVQSHMELNVTLRDCLFLFESERNTKKSSLLYKWYTRLPTGK